MSHIPPIAVPNILENAIHGEIMATVVLVTLAALLTTVLISTIAVPGTKREKQALENAIHGEFRDAAALVALAVISTPVQREPTLGTFEAVHGEAPLGATEEVHH